MLTRLWFLTFCVAVLLAFGRPAFPNDKDSASLPADIANSAKELSSRILSAFRIREETVRSFRFEWSETVTPGARPRAQKTTENLTASEAQMRAMAQRFEETLLLPKKCVFVMDGDRVRFEQEGPHAGREPGVRVPFECLSVYDGTTGTSFISRSLSSHPMADITNDDSTHALEYVGSQPIVLMYRGTDTVRTTLSQSPDRAMLLKRGVIGDQECVILTVSQDSGHLAVQASLWLDPTHDFRLLRVDKTIAGELRSRTGVSFKEDRKWGMIPIEWTSSYWNRNGQLQRTVHILVSSYEINPVLPRSQFELQFTPGTLVRDLRPGMASYILLANGKKKMLREGDLQSGVTYDELLKSEESIGARPLLVLAAVGILFVLGFFATRRVRRTGGVRFYQGRKMQ